MLKEARLAGYFVTVEGGEGVGKSTFCRGLISALEKLGISPMLTHEPGGTPLGGKIRQLFLEPEKDAIPIPRAELFLVSAARTQHIEHVIQPAIADDKLVVCDRYADSTRVYQGVIGGVERSLIESVIEESIQGCIPDLTFLLTCPPETCLERISERGGAGNRFDDGALEFHAKLHQGFANLANEFPQRFQRIDATASPEAMVQSAVEILRASGGPVP